MDSLIGTLPDSWTQATLGEVCDILTGPSGARLQLEARTSSNVPMIVPKDLQNNRIAVDGSAAVSPEVAEKLRRFTVTVGDIVCTRTGELGRLALVCEGQSGWLVGSACLRLRGRGMISTAYLIHYLSHPAVRDWISRNATGSAIPSLNTKTLGSMPIVVPPATVQSVVAEVLGALDEKIAVHDRISRTTEMLRDSLLPLLLTGSTETETALP